MYFSLKKLREGSDGHNDNLLHIKKHEVKPSENRPRSISSKGTYSPSSLYDEIIFDLLKTCSRYVNACFVSLQYFVCQVF
jgi:hypothetical protein